MSKRGMEELDNVALGSYLQRLSNGEYIMLRGKYQGIYARTIPSGYTKNVILKKCLQDLTEYERTLFESWCTAEESNGSIR